MKYRKLGDTNLNVSLICLGTMSFGEQNTEKDAHEQLTFALDHGVNFIDTAEMYAIPPKESTQGLTEKYIGSWVKKNLSRDKYIIATKVAGPGMEYIRGGTNLSKEHVTQAIDASLKTVSYTHLTLPTNREV